MTTKAWLLYEERDKERFWCGVETPPPAVPFFSDCPWCRRESWYTKTRDDFNEFFMTNVVCDRCGLNYEAEYDD